MRSRLGVQCPPGELNSWGTDDEKGRTVSYSLAQPSTLQRSGFLGIVVGGHIGLFAVLLLAKTIAPVAPAVPETPLIVDLLTMAPAAAEQRAQPLPVSRPQPTRPRVVPQRAPAAVKSPLPALETTTSAMPAPNAVVAAQETAKPEPSGGSAGGSSGAASGAAKSSDSASGEVTQARFDAGYLRNPAPPYPAISRRMGEEGKVVLRVQVSAQGTAESVEVRTSSGSSRLDESAQRTVRNWKFVPAKRGDAAVQSSVLVPIIFKLEQ